MKTVIRFFIPAWLALFLFSCDQGKYFFKKRIAHPDHKILYAGTDSNAIYRHKDLVSEPAVFDKTGSQEPAHSLKTDPGSNLQPAALKTRQLVEPPATARRQNAKAHPPEKYAPVVSAAGGDKEGLILLMIVAGLLLGLGLLFYFLLGGGGIGLLLLVLFSIAAGVLLILILLALVF